MTDETPTPQPQGALSVFTCINRRHPSRSCYALIENIPEVRQKHRQWHLDQETDREALRGAIKERDETIAKYRDELSGYRRDVAGYTQEVAGFHGEVQRVETPIVPPQLEIDRGGYSDDELDDEPDEPPVVFTREDLLSEIDPTRLADADTHNRPTVVPPAAQDDEADDDDDDDGDDPHTIALPTTAPSWAR